MTKQNKLNQKNTHHHVPHGLRGACSTSILSPNPNGTPTAFFFFFFFFSLGAQPVHKKSAKTWQLYLSTHPSLVVGAVGVSVCAVVVGDGGLGGDGGGDAGVDVVGDGVR